MTTLPSLLIEFKTEPGVLHTSSVGYCDVETGVLDQHLLTSNQPDLLVNCSNVLSQ